MPPPPSTGDGDEPSADDAATPTHRSGWRPWAELMARSFAIDVEKCPGCGCKMKLCRLVTGRDDIVELLTDLGQPIDPPPRAPARGPPYFQSRALGRRFGEPREPREPGEPEEQLDLFD